MVGFNKKGSSDEELFDGEDFDLDFEDDIGVPNTPPQNNKRNKPNKEETQETEGPINWKNPKKDKNNSDDKTKIVVICVSIVVVMMMIVGVFIWRYTSNKAKAEELRQQQIEQLEKDKQNQNKDDDKVSTGVPNFYADKNNQNDNNLTSSDKLLTDLNKEPVNVDYKIKQIKTVTEFINYEKFRAKTADGLEFYWLEAIYKDRPYKVQVPLSIYKELENRGITVVDAEVAVLENNSEIVTYMQVRKDAKTLLERR